jgi:hypothetical protein
VAELQGETFALGQELSRQLEMNAVMRQRMEDAEVSLPQQRRAAPPSPDLRRMRSCVAQAGAQSHR